jgi:hypothetical protein
MSRSRRLIANDSGMTGDDEKKRDKVEHWMQNEGERGEEKVIRRASKDRLL